MNRPVLLTFLLIGVGCGGSISGPEDAMSTESLQNRLLFLSAVGSSYSYFYENSCACSREALQPVAIEVLNGVIQSVVVRADGTSIPSARWGNFLTVLDVFAKVDAALAGGADFVQATYDVTLGYPRDVHIDFAERVGIDDIGYSIHNLSVIKE